MEFPQSVCDYLRSPTISKFIFWKGDDGGVTGRMGCFETAFRMVNGYDEDMTGNGAEDIDLKSRFHSHKDLCIERGLVYKDWNWRRFSAGWSVCNDINGHATRGLNEAKMINVAPEVAQGKSWGKHNGANWKKVENKTSQIRNEMLSFEGLGYDWREVDCANLGPKIGDVVPKEPTGRQMSWGRVAEPFPVPERYSGLKTSTRTISMVSYGYGLWELLWGYSPDLQSLGEAGPDGIKKDAFVICSMRGRGIIKKDDIVVSIDASLSLFKVKSGTAGHCGMHPESIGELVRILFLEPYVVQGWMRKISEAAAAAERTGCDVVLLCLDSKQGRRATGVAILLQHLLEAMSLQASIGEINHLARPLWVDRLCGPCAECTGQSVQRDAYLQIWRQI